ncbi:hypothetical protein C3K47_08240 [Solitalea longa]|uniref:Uncharacterized protein n=1 Tax=Solitalea longa TaxID=2079460 RepID=A0A2S5A3Z9_9SPHI|nr:hypothetical protein [Solitalea longa]POY37037.1 hypothetical protein C3K47_08240 [Solitalea longa]
MEKKYLLMTICLFIVQQLFAQAELTRGASVLFNNVKTKLSIGEKNQVFELCKLTLSSDEKGFLIDTYPVSVAVYPADLNKDSKEEVFVILSSGALYGNTGQSFNLFIKSSLAGYKADPNLSGGIPILLSSTYKGFPDIVIGGPGFKFPVYRWNGNQYNLLKTISDAELQKLETTEVETVSKTYQQSLPEN